MKFDSLNYCKNLPAQIKSYGGIAELIGMVSSDPKWSTLEQVAYLMATVAWETAHTYKPIEEMHPYTVDATAYFNYKYNGRLGNRPGSNDGYVFRGRGYVQLTGRDNYQRCGDMSGVKLIDYPASALVPATAYQIAAKGMRGGWFSGHKLDDYIGNGRMDLVGARHIINGSDHAVEISRMAQASIHALRESQC